MVECEEVEDEDTNARAKAGCTDHTEDDVGEEEEAKQDNGGMGYSKVLKGKQRMVECEEVTDYSESGGSEEGYEDNDVGVEETDRDEEDEIPGGRQML